MNQCWNIFNWTLRNKLQWNFGTKFMHFHPRKCIWVSHLWNGSHVVLASLCVNDPYKVLQPSIPAVTRMTFSSLLLGKLSSWSYQYQDAALMLSIRIIRMKIRWSHDCIIFIIITIMIRLCFYIEVAPWISWLLRTLYLRLLYLYILNGYQGHW